MTESREDERRFEPFLHLVDVTDTAALIAWGGFLLRRRGGEWFVVDDDDLDEHPRRDGGTIGAGSPSYGPALVQVLDGDGRVVSSARADDANHAWVEGLEPDTEYRYRVLVDGRPWADGERWDWIPEGDGEAGPQPCGRRYDPRLRTHPGPDARVPVAFVAFGDYGVGIVHPENGGHQRAVAEAMAALAQHHDVRFLVSLGDNIYHGEEDRLAQSGDEDDDWYFTFYEPYRYLIDHLPVYPAAGNHDGSDEEANDDRAQLEDNFHLHSRFEARVRAGRASLGPGLFYRLGVGALLELVCVDTSWGEHEGAHYFDDERHRPWLEDAFAPDAGRAEGDRSAWRIPFCHHPPYCAGPHHDNMADQIEHLVPLYRRGGVRLVLSGHEHNFQHGEADGVAYVVSGAAGKLQEDPPTRFADGGTRSWASEPHCLLVEVDEDRIVVIPYGAPATPGGTPRPIERRTPDGTVVAAPVVIARR